jgi:hypothetical protein
MIALLLGRLRLLIDFVAARGLQFLAPVMAANLLPATVYGAVEFAHAAASLLAGVLGLGLPGLIPLALVRGDTRYPLRTLLRHQLWVAAALLLVALCSVAAGLPVPTMAAVLCAALVLQVANAYVLRSAGRASASLYLEAAPFTLIALGAGWAWLMPAGDPMLPICVLLLGFVVLLGWYSIGLTSRQSDVGDAQYGRCLRAGVPLMLAGLLSVLLATSARLGAGMLGDAAVTAELAAIARITALPVVVHQLIIVAKFRELYALPEAVLQRLLLGLLLAVTASGLLLWCLLPWISPWLGSAFADASGAHPHATRLLIAQVLIWSGIAMNDLLATRASLMSLILPWTLLTGLAGLGLAGGWLWAAGADVWRIAAAQTGVMVLVFVVQSLLLAAHGVRHRAYWGGTLAIGAVLVLLSHGVMF